MDELTAHLGPGLRLRSMEASDLPFLASLYAATRERELALLPWTAPEKEAFLSFQFKCQHQHYQQHYSAARFDIIERDIIKREAAQRESEPIGRLYLAPLEGELRIMDIALLPNAQRRGIGTSLLRAVLEHARGEGRSVSIHVEKANPALALYRRLGFEVQEDRGVYLFLVRAASLGVSS